MFISQWCRTVPCEDSALAWWCRALCFFKASLVLNIIIRVKQFHGACGTSHCAPCNVTLLVSSGKFMSGLDFFLSSPENKKAKFAFCTLKRKGGSTQKQPFLTVRFRGALLTKSVTLEFSEDTVWVVLKTCPLLQVYQFSTLFKLHRFWRLPISQ